MYFDTQFDAFASIDYSEEALLKTLEVLLFKSSTSSKFSRISDKLNDFWSSKFIDSLTLQQTDSENFILALSQYLRSSSVDKAVVLNLLELNQESVIQAVRQSGVIAHPDHHSWIVLQNIANERSLLKLDDFLQTVECIQSQYQERLNAYQLLKSKLQLDQVTAMIFSSLYAYEYLMNDMESLKIPYQFNTDDNVSIEDIWSVFHYIITSSNIERTKLTDKKLSQVLKAIMMPFLIGEGPNHALIERYESFKMLLAYKIEVHSYHNQVIDAYSYKLSTNYYLKNGQLILDAVSPNTDFFQEKFTILAAYWQWRGVDTLIDNPYFERLDKGRNIESNALALAKTQGVVLQLREVYGIENAAFEQDYDLYSLIFTMLLSQAHYVHDFVKAFKKISDSKSQHTFASLAQLMMEGLVIGQNRMPVTFSKHKEKSIKMSDWIIEGSKNKRVKEMSRILDFWSRDLKEGSDQSYVEKSFYKIDDYLFALPWMSAQKNFNTATINTFRKLYKNRANLKSETDLMEQNLAELLSKCTDKVYSQYEPSEAGVGEIDAIAIANNKVLIIELKSTYIKSSVKEIYEYRNLVLKKAAYQLSRKTKYVEEVFLPNQGLDASKFSIHSWIVDTTLEFDHEYIDDFLKLSFEELVIILNGHEQYLFNMPDSNDETHKNIHSVVAQSLDTMIDTIESNNFWNTNLLLINSIKNIDDASKLRL